MELHLPDVRIGRDFSDKILKLCGVPVAYGEDGPSSLFALLVSFSRFRFMLSPELVGACLASILGGTSNNFAVSQLDDQIFRFNVSCNRVGFLVLQLASFDYNSFHLAFHLYNDMGFQADLSFSKKDSGPSWTEVRNRKRSSSSYADVIRSYRPPLTGANQTPLGSRFSQSTAGFSHDSDPRTSALRKFGRPNASNVQKNPSGPHANRTNGSQCYQSQNGFNCVSVFQRISFPRKSVFERLVFPPKQRRAVDFQNLNSRSKGPAGINLRPSTVAGQKQVNIFCKRCLSPNHLRHVCRSLIKCWRYNLDGHILINCPNSTVLQKPVVIHGEDFIGRFSSYSMSHIWQNMRVDTWFKKTNSMTSGPHSGGPEHANPLKSQETAHDLNAFTAPSHSQSPPVTAQENPNGVSSAHCSPHCPPAASPPADGSTTPTPSMVFLDINPNPLMLPGFSKVVVQGNEPFIRMATPRAVPRNEDLAIVTVSPLPEEEVPFAEICDVILGLLVEEYGLQIQEVQMCPFGCDQAFVRFARISDRDGLIAHSLHHHHGFSLRIVQHNRGDNARGSISIGSVG